ncbi:hypothetical protein ACOI22_13970 [Glaciecola sp. 2405UD65-10]|uniref:hypothetical protein n=1 Tax=Glaciecola sp. 2405UD65-10 TaxID=3397244 RepID=UPI003B5AB0F7
MFKHIFKRGIRLVSVSAIAASVVLTACSSNTRVSDQPLLVGPSPVEQTPTKQGNAPELVNAKVFLDVAIPTFDPGFPTDSYGNIDGDELEDEGIWPELRRTESKLFSSELKAAMDDEKVFASVSVVPDASTPSDLFVLGKINHSDSEVVNISITVVDSTGEIRGTKEFEHTVSKGFLRDQRNKDKNPYEPVFQQASNYVVSLLSKMSLADKEYIKSMSLMRYARYYSPEKYEQYISTELKRKNGQRYYKFELTGLPDDDDPMLKRIEDLRAQELLFVDRLQDNYDVFEAKTQDAYGNWQAETLPEVVAAREAQQERNAKAILGVGAAILAAVLAKNSNSSLGEAGSVVAGIGSVFAISDAFKNNARMKQHSAVIEEQGKALDLTVSPMVIEFEDQVIELKGTAQEQYLQWKTHLRKVFQEEETPNVQL